MTESDERFMQAHKGGHKPATWLYAWLGHALRKTTWNENRQMFNDASGSCGFAAYYLGDYKRAIELLKPLAERQHPHAQHLLHWCLQYFRYAKQDTTDKQWREKAKAQGHRNAALDQARLSVAEFVATR